MSDDDKSIMVSYRMQYGDVQIEKSIRITGTLSTISDDDIDTAMRHLRRQCSAIKPELVAQNDENALHET